MATRRENTDLSVSPGLAVAILAVVALLIGGKFWASGEAAGVDAPTDLRETPDGRLAVLQGRILYIGHPEAGKAQRFDLAELEASERLAALDFFPNGDVLIWRDPGSPGWITRLMEGLRTLAGGLGIDVAVAERSKAHLARCDLEAGRCDKFLAGPQAPRPPYGVQIAPDGTVYMTDSAEHRIGVYSPSGEERTTMDEGLFYPNGMWRADGQLWVANTEEQQIVSVATEPEFDANVARHPYDYTQGTTDLRPIDLASVGDHWWVVEIGKRLVGESVARLDGDWQRIDSLALGEAAQPADVLPYAGTVYVADSGRFRVHRFEPGGKPAGELQWRGLQSHLGEARSAQRLYTWTGHGLWALFVALVAGGLVVGYRQGGIATAGVDGVALRALGLEANDPSIQFLVFALAQPALIGLNSTAVKFAALALLIAGFAWGVTRPIVNARIGTFQGWLILHDGRRQVAGRGDAIDYTDEGIAIDDIAVPLGRSHQRLFRQDQIQAQVNPIIERATRVSRSRMQLRILHSYPSMAAAIGLFLVGFLVWLGFYGPMV